MPAKKAGDSIGALIGGGLIAGAVGIVSVLDELINTLASAGDRAADLRLPINIIQALSVAADEARVRITLLNSAWISSPASVKKSKHDAEEFYTALNNIGPAWLGRFNQRRPKPTGCASLWTP